MLRLRRVTQNALVLVIVLGHARGSCFAPTITILCQLWLEIKDGPEKGPQVSII